MTRPSALWSISQRFNSFSALLVSYYRWLHTQYDVTSAYLYAPLREDVYMTQLPGFVAPGQEDLCCKLEHALYGLHQSGWLQAVFQNT